MLTNIKEKIKNESNKELEQNSDEEPEQESDEEESNEEESDEEESNEEESDEEESDEEESNEEESDEEESNEEPEKKEEYKKSDIDDILEQTDIQPNINSEIETKTEKLNIELFDIDEQLNKANFEYATILVETPENKRRYTIEEQITDFTEKMYANIPTRLTLLTSHSHKKKYKHTFSKISQKYHKL